MTDIGQWLIDLFGSLGPGGLLVAIFLLFYIDAILIPTLPEVFTILIFATNPTLEFAIEILAVIAIAELLGLTTLYVVVKRLHVPKKIQSALDRYTKLLIVKDEKIIILNRLAPVLPFMGAFAAVCHWSYRRCVAYTLIGGMVKYGIILALGGILFAYLSSDMAMIVS
ncbi:MAG TPA: hypothetical protein VLH13_01670, partial [Methanomassiliicoccales archaeon]|nr:hypothetical protein [Methanomassiliicoccales archaeon]